MVAQLHAITEAKLPNTFMLGDHRVDLRSHSVSLGNREVRLTPKAARVLEYLVRRPGKAIGRDQLLEHGWSGSYPTDDVLSHAITEIRRAFGDSPRKSVLIETLPKVGYRLLKEPTLASEAAGPGSARQSKSWLVLAFVAGGLAGMGVAWWSMPKLDPAPIVGDPLLAAFPLTAEPGPETMPAISNDGRDVAYLAAAEMGEAFDVYIKNMDGDVSTAITSTPEHFEFSPTWSPDGRSVGFLRFGEEAGCQVVLSPVDGGLERVLGPCHAEAITYLDWSPGGRFLAMVDQLHERSTLSIVLLEVETGLVHPLDYAHDADEHDVQPKYSPDGAWLAFRRGANPRSELYLVSADGGGVRALTAMGSRIYGFDWLPDSDRIWLCSEYAGQPSLWEVGLDDPTPKAISARCPVGLSIAHDEAAMAFEDVANENSMLLYDGEERSVFPSTRDESDGAFSPDGEQVVFVSNRGGEDQIWLGRRGTGEAFQLTRLAGLKLSTPQFFNDGARVLFLGQGGGRESAFEVDVRSAIVQRVSAQDERVRSLFPAYDGNGVYLTSNRDGAWQIWHRSAEGAYRRMTETGGHRPFDPGDGFLYFTKTDRYGLWRVPLAGGEEQHISSAISYAYHDRWLIRDNRLIIPRYVEKKHWLLMAYDLAGPEEQEGETLMSLPPDRELILSDVRGSEYLLFEMQNRRRDVLGARDFVAGPAIRTRY